MTVFDHLKHKNIYKIIKASLEKIINKATVGEPDGAHDFSLDSGERQTGLTLSDIRTDHKERYRFAIEYMKKNLRNQDILGLDLFCGNGYGTYMLSIELSCSILGIDGSADAVSLANCHYSGSEIFYSHKEFPFRLPVNSFDFITCYESIEHVEDAVLLLEQLVASLKKGGYLFLSTPNEKCFPHKKNVTKFHYRHYTMAEIIGLFDAVDELELLTWLGQDLYLFSDGKISSNLPDAEMGLHEEQEGQLLIFALKKKG